MAIKSIKIKLIFWICILFILIGAALYFPLSRILSNMMVSQILKRDVNIAQYIAAEAGKLMLLDDDLSLNMLLHDNLRNLEDAKYLFIQDANLDVISHTFTAGFPKALLTAYKKTKPDLKSIKKFKANGKFIYDIVIPLFEGKLGLLHLGVSLESKKPEMLLVSKINYYVLIVLFLGLGFGVFIFLILGVRLSNRIIQLKNFAKKIGNGDLQARLDVKTDDEIGSLTSAFNDMTQNLRKKIEDVKRINIQRERNRIAAELHDDLLQSLADITLRLEFCHRVFKDNPEEAMDELVQLKENTRNILRNARQAIFDLKSSTFQELSLFNFLSKHIENFNRKTLIKTNLDIGKEIDDASSELKKSIFYIVSEALANVKKHSNAKNVDIKLKVDNSQIRLKISDDGKGFNLEDISRDLRYWDKLGLDSMREMAESLGGRFNIDTAPDNGTKITASLPIIDTHVTKEDFNRR